MARKTLGAHRSRGAMSCLEAGPRVGGPRQLREGQVGGEEWFPHGVGVGPHFYSLFYESFPPTLPKEKSMFIHMPSFPTAHRGRQDPTTSLCKLPLQGGPHRGLCGNLP